MQDYEVLVVRILSALTGELLPNTSWHVPERNEQRVAIAVCDVTQMSPERWDRLSKDERIPWLYKTIKVLEKKPAPNAWIAGDDLPTYFPEFASVTAISQLSTHLVECRQRLADHRIRNEYVPLTCRFLRLEGPGRMDLFDQPFARILIDRPFFEMCSTSQTESIALAFTTLQDRIAVDRIRSAIGPVEALTGEILPLLRDLPPRALEILQLPECDNCGEPFFISRGTSLAHF